MAADINRPQRAWWQWAVGAVLVLAAASYAWVSYGPSVRLRSSRMVQPLVIHVPPKMRESDVVPAAAGDLAGCNLLLVTFDTTRADRIGCYGNEAIRTPNLDRLAAEGVIFSRAIAPSPVTLPSHASILTGLYPFHHGARTNTMSRLDADNTTMAEVLAGAGYSTAAMVSAFVLDAQFGTDQGFQDFDDEVAEVDGHGVLKISQRSADATTERAVQWLRGHTGEKFFLWVHYYDPHYPREAPREFLQTHKLPYDAEIAFADSQLGALLEVVDELGVTDTTLVVAAGDHGEGLGQHREPTHAFLIYDSTLRVPLVMRCGRRLGGGVHVGRWVSLVDIMPTALSLLGVQGPAGMDGVDLTRPGADDRPLYAETLEAQVALGWASLIGVQAGAAKYIYGPDAELYDLADDPFEEINLVGRRPDLAARMQTHLKAMYGGDLAQAASLSSTSEPSTEVLARLRSLGYVSGGSTGAAPSAPRPHPRKMIPLVERAFAALAVERDLGLDEVIARLKRLAKDHPDFVAGREYLGDAYVRAGDLEAAEAEFVRCLELRPGRPLALLALARVKRNQKQFDEAAVLYRQLIDQLPDDSTAQIELGRMLLRQRKPAEAVSLLRSALQLRPRDAKLPGLIANILSKKGRPDEAVELFWTLLATEPNLPMVRNALARLLNDAERYSEAVAVLREGIALSPDQPELTSNLAYILISCPEQEVRNPAQAAAMMERICEQTDYRNATYLHTLSMVYAATSRFDEAITVARDALRLAGASPRPREAKLARSIRESLADYRDRKAQKTQGLP